MRTNTSSELLRIVSNQAELDAAYQELKDSSGGTIVLEATDPYTLIFNDREGTTDAAVSIRSADTGNPATFEEVRLTSAENLTIENVQFHMDGDEERSDDVAIRLNDSTNITIQNSVMTSDAGGPLGTSDGFTEGARLAIVSDSQDVTFEGNEISGFSHGLAFQDSYDVQVLNNTMTELQGDGIRVAGVTGMQIEGNHLHDFYGSTQDVNHSDLIQIWGANIGVNNQDITIRENFLDTGNGANFQMIYGSNKNQNGTDFVFSDILIEGNVLFGSHANAVALSGTNNVTVTNNTIINNIDAYDVMADGSQTDATLTNRIEIDGTNTLIENNISERVVGGVDNALLTMSSPHLENDYRAHFVNVEAGGSGDLRDLMLRPDSELNGVAGSWLTWSTDTAETLTAVVDVTLAANDNSLVTLDASLTRGPDGYVAASDATFSWLFADGTTASGLVVEHDFDTAGTHGYQLTVTHNDGSIDQIMRTIEIDSAISVDFTFEGDTVSNIGLEEHTVLLHENAEISDGQLSIGGRDRLEVTRETTSLFNLNDFNIGLTVDTATGASGTLLHLPRTFEASVDADGHLQVSLTTDEGTFEMRSDNAIFADNGAHVLNFVYDGTAETLSLLVDGAVDTVISASGITADKEHWGFTVGARWGESVEAEISDFYVLTEAVTLEDAEATLPGMAPTFSALEVSDIEDGQIELTTLDYALSNAAMITENGYDISKGNVSITKEHAALHEADAFSVGFDMILGDTDTSGTVMYLHDMMRLSLDDHGRLVFRMQTEDGWAQIASDPLDLGTTALHHVEVNYDAGQETMQVLVDGTVVASGSQTGLTEPASYWDLYLGHPWSDNVTDAVVSNLTIDDAAGSEAPVQNASVSAALSADDVIIAEPVSEAETLLFLDFEGASVLDKSGNGAEVTLTGTDTVVAQDDVQGGQVLEVGDASAVSVSRNYDALYELDNFLFSFDVRSDEADGRKVFGIHKSYQLDVEGNDFVFSLETDEGKFVLETDGDLLADNAWHSVEIAYSDEHDQLQMVVDGTTVATTEASGTTQAREHWGLELGLRWGEGFDGAIDKFALATDIGAHHFEI